MLLASAVDPLFFLLPVLEKAGTRFSPLDQHLSTAGGSSGTDLGFITRLAGVHAALAAICDVNDSFGSANEELLFRLNHGKVTGWLAAKARRIACVFQQQAAAASARAQMQLGSFAVASVSIAAAGGAGSSAPGASSVPAASPRADAAPASSSAGDASPSGAASAPAGTGEEALQHEHLATALQVLGEYVADTWLEAAAGELW
jgi:hypothetical protein